jgi:hypothetical protein
MFALQVIEPFDPHMVEAPIFTGGKMITPGQMPEHQFMVGKMLITTKQWATKFVLWAHART